MEELQQNNEYELQQIKTELIEKHEKAMQELQTQLEETQNNELAEARKSAIGSRANFTMSMDSLDVDVCTYLIYFLARVTKMKRKGKKRREIRFMTNCFYLNFHTL